MNITVKGKRKDGKYNVSLYFNNGAILNKIMEKEKINEDIKKENEIRVKENKSCIPLIK